MLCELLDVIGLGKTAEYDSLVFQLDSEIADATAGPERDSVFQILLQL
jgi:hypothetical protein